MTIRVVRHLESGWSRSTRRFVAVVVVVCALGMGCGPGSDQGGAVGSRTTDDPVEAPLGSVVPRDWREVVEGVVTARDGDRVSGAVAVLMAGDRGYDRFVVLEAAVVRRLTGEGFVVAPDGAVIVPTGSDGGVISDKPALDIQEGAAASSMNPSTEGDVQPASFVQAWRGDNLLSCVTNWSFWRGRTETWIWRG